MCKITNEHWHAGWTMPGYLPETPYETFPNCEGARAYIAQELASMANSADPEHGPHYARTVEASEIWALSEREPCARADRIDLDGYAYETFPCDDAACVITDGAGVPDGDDDAPPLALVPGRVVSDDGADTCTCECPQCDTCTGCDRWPMCHRCTDPSAVSRH